MLCMNRADIIKAIEAYAEASGLKPSSICQLSVQNSRLYDRLLRSVEHDNEIGKRLTEWIAANPPQREAAE